jgi:RHS repeat-associated protein
MYRLNGMTTSAGATVVSGVSYNAANRLLGMTYNGIGETRGYNVLNQLTSIAASGESLTYNYPTGTNNGKISSMYNAISGETITYTYDSLNRLITANGSGWGESYTFDGFGNLSAKTVTSGSGPSFAVTANPGNNQLDGIPGTSYDANGNMASVGNGGVGYDAENRVSVVYQSSAYLEYGYDAQNRRTFLWPSTYDAFPSSTGGNPTGYSVVMYSPTGQKLGTYQINTYNTSSTNIALSICSTLMSSDQYFGARRLAVLDQLGSAGTYFPWGEDKGTTNPQNTWGFGTYWQDSATGLDYANQRYYNSAYGRFMTVDSGRAHPKDPVSWNRYSYTGGDPVNRSDPRGLDWLYDFSSGQWYSTIDLGCESDPAYCQALFSNPMALMYDMQSASYQDMLAFNAAVSNAAQLTPVPSCVQGAIASGAQGLGLDIASFDSTFNVQIVGTPNGQGGTTPFGETELNMTGTTGPDGTVQGLINQMCQLGFYSNDQCPGSGGNNSGVGPPHTAPNGVPFSGNFRAPGLTGSLQVNTNVATGQIQMDIDNFNPADGALGAFMHAIFQVVPNMLTGTDNTYGCPLQ